MSVFTHVLSRTAPHGVVTLDDFRAGMRSLTGAVTVLTTTHEGVRFGLTATAVCSLSADPPRLIACVNQRGVSYGAMQASRRLAVNVLAHDQFSVAERFAGMDRSGSDRFALGGWHPGKIDGLPVSAGAVCVFECKIAEVIDAVTHGIMICDIFQVKTNEGARPLLYCDGRFTTLEDELVDPRHSHHF